MCCGVMEFVLQFTNLQVRQSVNMQITSERIFGRSQNKSQNYVENDFCL